MNRRLLLLVLIGGCYTGAELCAKHKWGYTQTVVGDGNGAFDGTCRNIAGFSFTPDLPNPAEFHGTSYVSSQDDHQAVKRVINAITVGNWVGVSTNDIDVYLALVDQEGTPPVGIDLSARNACIDWLETQGCAVDGPNSLDSYDLCNAEVMNPVQVKLTDLSGCLTDFPISEAPQYVTANPASDCDYQFGYTDDGGGSPMCVADGTTAGDDGADTTGGAPEDFGDLDMLISCTPWMAWEQYCSMNEQLLHNVVAGFRIFYDEGVWLEATNIAGVSRGVQISASMRTRRPRRCSTRSAFRTATCSRT